MIKKFLIKIFLIDLLMGLAVTLKYTFKRKATIEYPEKVKVMSERFRGLLRLHRDAQGVPLCIACKMCQRACPQNCFDIEGQRDESNKMRPVKFDWKLERCSFCGFCAEVCPTKAIRFSKEFRLATRDRKLFLFHMAEMYDDLDVQAYLRGEPVNKPPVPLDKDIKE